MLAGVVESFSIALPHEEALIWSISSLYREACDTCRIASSRLEIRGKSAAAPCCDPRGACLRLVAMSKTRSEVLQESRKKGIVAGATTAGAVAAGVVVAPVAGALVAVPAAWLAYKWWKHRAENGIRF